MAGNSKISAVFGTDTRELERGIKRAQATLNSLKGTTGGLSSAMRSLNNAVSLSNFIEIGKIAASSIGRFSTQVQYAVGQASDLGEAMSKSSQIFGENAGEIEKFAASASSLGLSKVAALEAATGFGNMFTAMKLSNQQSADMSLTFTRLASDLASFNNTDPEEAVSALGAALRGESEPIRRFGVLLDDATLRAKAFELGMSKTAKDAMTPAIKAQAAYAAILEQTAKAQGDFERTSGGLANINRIVAAKMKNLSADLGGIFEPVLATFGSEFARIVDGFTDMVKTGVKAMGDGIKGVGPTLINVFWDSAEIFARTIDIFNLAFNTAKNVFTFFRDIIPGWDDSVSGFNVAINTFERLIVLFQAAVAGIRGAFNFIIGGWLSAAKFVMDAAANVGEVLGYNVEALRAAASESGALAEGFRISSKEYLDEAARLGREAFSLDFKGTDLSKRVAAVFTDGTADGIESWVERLRAWRKEADEKTAEAAAAAGSTIAAGMANGFTAITKEASTLLVGTKGASNYVAGLLNNTSGSVEKRMANGIDRIAAATEQMAGESRLAAISIA